MTASAMGWWACRWCETRNRSTANVCRICERPDASVVAQIQGYLIENADRWLIGAGLDAVNLGRLAMLVYELLLTHSAAVRAVNTELGLELVAMDAEMAVYRVALHKSVAGMSNVDCVDGSGEQR